jgi:hypothetical protein
MRFLQNRALLGLERIIHGRGNQNSSTIPQKVKYPPASVHGSRLAIICTTVENYPKQIHR